MFKKLFFFTLTSLLGVFLTVGAVLLASAAATDRYVAPTGTDSGNNCANPNNPCATLLHAVQQTDAGDTVIVAAGWYSETDTIRLFRDMTIQGADLATTILSAPNDPDVWHALQVYGEVTATVRGLTIRNADRNGVSNLGTLTLEQVAIVDNRGVLGGGGIYNNGTLTILDSLIVNNLAMGSVAAGLLNFGQAEIYRTAFIGNQTDSPSTYGGGLHNQGQLTLENVTFALNQAGSGTAISNGGGVITMTHVTIANNASLLPSPEDAQAITNNGGQIYIANSLIGDNGPNQQCTGDVIPVSLGGNLDFSNSCGFNQPTDQINTYPLPLTLVSSPLNPLPMVFELLPNSPAINAAVSAHCPATDARGVARPYGAACDIGSYEFDGVRLYLPLVVR